MDFLAGFDIGGTKCAVIVGRENPDGVPEIIAKERFATCDYPEPKVCIGNMCCLLLQMLEKLNLQTSDKYFLRLF